MSCHPPAHSQVIVVDSLSRAQSADLATNFQKLNAAWRPPLSDDDLKRLTDAVAIKLPYYLVAKGVRASTTRPGRGNRAKIHIAPLLADCAMALGSITGKTEKLSEDPHTRKETRAMKVARASIEVIEGTYSPSLRQQILAAKALLPGIMAQTPQELNPVLTPYSVHERDRKPLRAGGSKRQARYAGRGRPTSRSRSSGGRKPSAMWTPA